jgi:hypothetical protein
MNGSCPDAGGYLPVMKATADRLEPKSFKKAVFHTIARGQTLRRSTGWMKLVCKKNGTIDQRDRTGSLK